MAAVSTTAGRAARYQTIKEIGVGGFGVVEVCLDRQTNSYVAVKHISSDKVHVEAKRLVREVDIMIRLRDKHPNVMSLLDAYITPPATSPHQHDPDTFDVHLVMPLMRGDLHCFTREMRRLPLPVSVAAAGSGSSAGGAAASSPQGHFYRSIAVVFAFHVAFGLDYLHKSGVVHRDLKPDNVLVNVDVNDPYRSVAMIADFGLARAASPTETFYICTRQYRPPEVITNMASGNPSLDIWSLGCVLYELVTSRTLFHLPTSLENGQWSGAKASFQLEEVLNVVGTPDPEKIAAMPNCNVKSYLQKTKVRTSQLSRLLNENFRLECDEVEKDMWRQLITRCLEFFPEYRPTAEQVCKCPLFQRYNVNYGVNVHQFPAIPYRGGATSELRAQNKQKVRSLIENTNFQIPVPPVEVAPGTPTGGGPTGNAPADASAASITGSRAGALSFPVLQNQALALKYAAVAVSSQSDVAAAAREIHQLIDSRTVVAASDGSDSDLRLLLNYFVALTQIAPTGEDDQVTIAIDADAEDDDEVQDGVVEDD